MAIETATLTQTVLKINSEIHVVNIREYESFLSQCKQFMDVDGDSLQVMTQAIADQLIDCAKGEIPFEEIRVQLKFLREIGFFFKGFVTPVLGPDQR